MPKPPLLTFSTFGADFPKTAIAFHGFGQSSQVFGELGRARHVMSFDLPFHGASPMPYGSCIEFVELFKSFFKNNATKSFELVGFSIGCRLACALLMCVPERISRVTLIAPEGLRFHPLYAFAVNTWLGRLLFRAITKSMGAFEPLLGFVERTKAFPISLIRMTRALMKSSTHRERVFHTWMIHRDFKVDLKLMASTIMMHNIDLELVVGKKDEIVRFRDVQALCSHLNDHPYTLHLLDTGHFSLLNAYFQQIK